MLAAHHAAQAAQRIGKLFLRRHGGPLLGTCLAGHPARQPRHVRLRSRIPGLRYLVPCRARRLGQLAFAVGHGQVLARLARGGWRTVSRLLSASTLRCSFQVPLLKHGGIGPRRHRPRLRRPVPARTQGLGFFLFPERHGKQHAGARCGLAAALFKLRHPALQVRAAGDGSQFRALARFAGRNQVFRGAGRIAPHAFFVQAGQLHGLLSFIRVGVRVDQRQPARQLLRFPLNAAVGQPLVAAIGLLRVHAPEFRPETKLLGRCFLLLPIHLASGHALHHHAAVPVVRQGKAQMSHGGGVQNGTGLAAATAQYLQPRQSHLAVARIFHIDLHDSLPFLMFRALLHLGGIEPLPVLFLRRCHGLPHFRRCKALAFEIAVRPPHDASEFPPVRRLHAAVGGLRLPHVAACRFVQRGE